MTEGAKAHALVRKLPEPLPNRFPLSGWVCVFGVLCLWLCLWPQPSWFVSGLVFWSLS